MLRSSYEICRVFGVPVRLDLSLIVLALMLSFRAGSLVVGLLAAALLMLSVALHELGHTFAALRFGCRVRDITLLLIGGRATLLDMPREPWKEFVLAVSGPLVSGVLWLGGIRLAGLAPAGTLPAIVIFWLAMINRMLFLFNLLPAFPMDGGRILRALLARRLGRLRATFIASRVGRILAVLIGIAGLFPLDIFRLLIAVFIFQAAEAEYRMVLMEERKPFFRGAPPEDQAYISPPPYRRGRDVADIFRDK
jgi:Zn-dependent protease